MKRKIVSSLILLGMVLFITSCGKEAPSNSSTSVDNRSNQEQSSSSVTTEENEARETPFERFEAALDNAKYSYESVPMAAELVGAKMGMKYKFDFGQLEIYQFEDDSEALSKAIGDKGLTLEGFGIFPCKFNGNLALLIDVTENEDDLLSIFDDL